MLNRIVFPTVTLMAVLIMGHVPLSAHGVLSKDVESGKIKFSFDNGAPLANGYVSVHDKDGQEIAIGQTDVDGIFDFSKYENVGKVTVADTHGHHRTHVIGDSRHTHSDDRSHDHDHDHHSNRNPLVMIVVVAALLAVAALFYLGNKKKNSPPAE